MKIHHIAIWTFQLEEMKEFYTRYFNGSSNEKYINPKKGFESYFLHFDEGTDLELMSRTDIQNTPIEEKQTGTDPLCLCLRQPGSCPPTDRTATYSGIYHRRRAPYLRRRIF